MKTVGELQWVSAMQQSHTRVAVEMSGFPFHFSLPPNWDTREQRLPAHLIYFVAKGECRVTAGRRTFTLATGQLCWVCPDVKFRFFLEGGKPAILQRFRLVATQEGRPLRLPWSARVFPDAAEAMEWARMLVEERPAGKFGRERVGALGALFSATVFASKTNASRSKGLPDAIRRRVTSHVLDHIGQRVSPGDLARLVGLSTDYFTRQFKQSFGASPREWMLRQRLRQAAGLLAETDERVSEIALRLGYPDVFLFSRQFKAEFGSSPQHWRRRHHVDALKV